MLCPMMSPAGRIIRKKMRTAAVTLLQPSEETMLISPTCMIHRRLSRRRIVEARRRLVAKRGFGKVGWGKTPSHPHLLSHLLPFPHIFVFLHLNKNWRNPPISSPCKVSSTLREPSLSSLVLSKLTTINVQSDSCDPFHANMMCSRDPFCFLFSHL